MSDNQRGSHRALVKEASTIYASHAQEGINQTTCDDNKASPHLQSILRGLAGASVKKKKDIVNEEAAELWIYGGRNVPQRLANLLIMNSVNVTLMLVIMSRAGEVAPVQLG